jgi:hypothetical protein
VEASAPWNASPLAEATAYGSHVAAARTGTQRGDSICRLVCEGRPFDSKVNEMKA